MKRTFVLVCLMLSACNEYRGPPASSYQRWTDQMIVRLGLEHVGVFPCKLTDRLDECYKMDPPKRWKGLWRNDFEGSRFCATPAKSCDGSTSRPYTWFDYYDPKLLPFGGLYRVDFIGRRTSVQGRYGHMGGSDYQIVVDRMISVEEQARPPQFRTKEDADAWLRECEAKPDCAAMREGLDMLNRKRRS